MTNVDTQSPLLAGIDKAIEEIEQRVRQEQEAAGRSAPGAARGGGVAAPAAPPRPGAPAPQPVSPQQSIEDLSVFLARLRQIRDWMQQDNRLLPVVDEFIGRKVAESEQRSNRNNLMLAGVTTLVGAVLGWLVSALGSPQGLLQLLGLH